MPITPLPIGGKLRFAAGLPTGIRGATWIVIGGTNDRDVYVGMRSTMNYIKFSLHASERWRLALIQDDGTEWEETPFRAPNEDPRVVSRLFVPPEDDGWRQALNIIVAEPGLQSPFREKPVKGTPVSWWPAPSGDTVRAFAIFVSAPGVSYEPSTFPFSDPVVGAIELPFGSHVVVVMKLFHRPETVQLVRDERKNWEESGWRLEGNESPFMARLGQQAAIVYDIAFTPA